MNLFERYLTVWVFLCIVAGIALGQFFPGVFEAIGHMEIAQVNLPVGLLIWVMIIPMLVKVDFGALGEVRKHVKGIGVTLFVNWLVKPFSMAFLGWLFIRHWFAPLLPPDQLDSYIAGLILLAAAPCTAMVLAYWLNRAVGEKHNIACPSALIGASNFFELAVAAAISLFGFNSGAALATVVGVLIEVPVMLLVVSIVNNSKGWSLRILAKP
jgi:arsenite transporter